MKRIVYNMLVGLVLAPSGVLASGGDKEDIVQLCIAQCTSDPSSDETDPANCPSMCTY